MSEETVVEAVVVEATPTPTPTPDDDDALLESLLLEEVSIDGMCGVY